ncbi:MAG: RadC family protein [Bacilli bacterium]|jgi:DNA repair protein RadC
MNYRLKDLDHSERPREKALKQGIDSLSDAELLALVFGSGTKKASVLKISEELLYRYQGLHSLSSFTHPSQIAIDGLGPNRKLALLAIFEIARRLEIGRGRKVKTINSLIDIIKHYQNRFSHLTQEVLFLVMLNHRKQVLEEKELYRGTATVIDVSIREVFAALLRANAVYFILIHNHPSGNPLPSQDDEKMTLEINQRARFLELVFFDHVIFAGNQYYSFREQFLLKKHR